MKKIIVLGLISTLFGINSYADTKLTNYEESTDSLNPLSIGVSVGTLGLGVNISLPIDNEISFRLNINKFKYNLDKKYKKVSFNGNLNLANTGILVDYFPENNFFRFSAGAYLNKNKVSGRSKFSKSTTIKVRNIKQKITDKVRIDTEVKFNNISPYVGMGWGNNTHKKGWNTTFDLGMIYQGLPEITFDTITKYDLTKERLKKDIKKEKARLKRFANKYKFYPVISVGISYSF